MQAFTFLRDFVLGSKDTGLVKTDASGAVSVAGGENSTLAEDTLRGGAEIFIGSLSTAGATAYPSATIAAWDSFIKKQSTAAPGKWAANGQGRVAATWVAALLCVMLFAA